MKRGKRAAEEAAAAAAALAKNQQSDASDDDSLNDDESSDMSDAESTSSSDTTSEIQVDFEFFDVTPEDELDIRSLFVGMLGKCQVNILELSRQIANEEANVGTVITVCFKIAVFVLSYVSTAVGQRHSWHRYCYQYPTARGLYDR